MIAFLKDWIVGIAVVSVLLSAIQSILPNGSIKKVGNFVGGLILFLTILTPLIKLERSELSWAMTEYRMQSTGSSDLLNLENTTLVKEIIEEQTEAYISDKAREFGAECRVEVVYEYSKEGVAYPLSSEIQGELTAEQREKLSEFIERELMIPKEKQFYEGVVVNAAG